MTRIYNVKDITLQLHDVPFSINPEVTGIANEGLNIKFDSTAEPINGIGGYTSYSIKSNNGASITLNLVSTSDYCPIFLQMYDMQMDGNLNPFKMILSAESDSFAFSKIHFENCMILEVSQISISRSVTQYEFSIKCGTFNIDPLPSGKGVTPQKLAGRTPSEVYVR